MDKHLVPFVADVLMGAAYADDRLHGQEALTIRSKLAKLLDVDVIPADLEERLKQFNPGGFEPSKAVAELGELDDAAIRQVLELVAEVNMADEELDLDEDCYLRRVADAFGLSRSAYKDLVLQIEGGDVCGSAKPPPLPTDA